MKRAIALASFLSTLLAAPVSADTVIRKISFSTLKAEGRLAGGEIVPAGGGFRFESLRVTNPDGAARTIPLFAIDGPSLKVPRYLLSGDVRGEGIEGEAYLEMWSFFAGGGKYFSRTLDAVGPTASFSGTFDFRPFILPFTAESGMLPEKLAANVVFPGRGTVSLANVELLQLDSDEYFFSAGVWLAAQLGTGCVFFGSLGAFVGILVSRDRNRGLVLGFLRGVFAFGVVALLAAALCFWLAEPPRRIVVLLLFGVICTILSASLLRKVRRRYMKTQATPPR